MRDGLIPSTTIDPQTALKTYPTREAARWVNLSTSKQSEFATRSNNSRRQQSVASQCALTSAFLRWYYYSNNLILISMINQVNGEVIVDDFIAPASVAFAFNDVVTRDANGRLALATLTTPRSELLGLIQTVIASTDSDYASTKTVPVLKFHDGAEFDADVDTGTLLTTMVGLDFDLADHNGIDVGSNVQKSVKISRFISSTQARIKFNTGEALFRLVSYQETVAFGAFTDGGGTSGTFDLGVSIPAGAVFQRTLVTAITGFAGDTTALIDIGDGTDVNRYNTTNADVFATAAAGISLGAASGTLWHTAAATPKLTITAGTDWGAVTAGSVTVTLFWYEAA